MTGRYYYISHPEMPGHPTQRRMIPTHLSASNTTIKYPVFHGGEKPACKYMSQTPSIFAPNFPAKQLPYKCRGN